MSTCLDGYMGRELYSDFDQHIITAAFKKPVFTTDLSHNWELAWKHKRVKQWSSVDVMAWFLYVIEDQERKDIVQSKLHNFNVKGLTLMGMTEDEFAERDPLYGQTLYRDLQKRLKEEREAVIPSPRNPWMPPQVYSCFQGPSPILDEHRVLTSTRVHKQPDLPELPPDWDSMWMNTPIYEWSELDVMAWVFSVLEKENLPIHKMDLTRFKCNGEDLLRMSKEDFKERSSKYGLKLYEAWICKRNEDCSTQFEERRKEISSMVPTPQEPEYPSSHSGSDSDDSMEDRPEMQNALPRRRAGGYGSLWPFLRDLLKSGKNSEAIDWVQRDKGIFKVKDSRKLAQLWGERKNNPNMNYEKMSRTLRYNYTSGYLKRVPGQRLVFGFGPYAQGWKCYEDFPVVPEDRT
ncbi:ETS-related transcription factor Elf-5 [Anabrus simplex]|uniref:ETS-related transcription factor Elf-5 n=1 Tax=Anabrus simplex TaxID=316456 RepID=UPI0035A31E5C